MTSGPAPETRAEVPSPWPAAHPERELGGSALARELEDGTVQVWLFSLDRPPEDLGRLEALLSPDERQRADRFRFEVHRNRYVAGRGILRRLLGLVLERSPEGLRFGYGAKGKPYLEAAPWDLRFNLSNSQDLALVGLTRGRELGVDLEAMRPLDDAPGIVSRFFAPRERQVFAEHPPERQLACFYAGWTRKEAYVKARGDGLSLPTTCFEVDLVPEQPARLVDFPEEPAEVGRWTFASLEPAEGFLGAVAVEGPGGRIVERLWRR